MADFTDLQQVVMLMLQLLSYAVLSPLSDLLSTVYCCMYATLYRQTSLPVTSFTHQFRNLRLLQSQAKRQAQEMARGNLQTLTIFLRF